MNTPTPKLPPLPDRPDVAALAAAYIDGSLDADGCARLNALLDTDPDARRVFVAMTLQSRWLTETFADRLGGEKESPAAGNETAPGAVPLSAAGVPIYRKGYEPKPTRIAITSDGGGNTSEAWIDGESVFNGTAIVLAAGTDNLVVGGGFPDVPAFNFDGQLDEVRIHNMGVDQTYIDSRVALLSGPAIPVPAALPAGLVMLGVIAGRRRRR